MLSVEDPKNALKVSDKNIIEHKDVHGNSVKSVILYSVYPRLAEKNRHPKYSSILKLNDIVVCCIDSKYMYSPGDITWYVKDHYTGKIYQEYKGYSLKYRIKFKTCYDVECQYTSYNFFSTDIKSSFPTDEKIVEKSAFICI